MMRCTRRVWLKQFASIGAVLVLSVTAATVPVHAGTTRSAASPALTDVQAAVSAASAGDIVVVPAGTGSVSWGGTLTLTRGIALQGPGRDSLTVKRAGPMLSIVPSAIALANNETFKVSGFTFDYNDASTPGLTPPAQGPVMVNGPVAPSVFQRLVFVDNRIKNTGYDTFGLVVRGQVRGVIADNDFDRCDFIISVMGQDDLNEWSALSGSRAFGTADNLYFEDNTIHYSSSYAIGDSPGWTEVGQGGRVVMRYNTWDLTNATGTEEYWDVHGMQNWPGGQTGTMITEYYGNTMSGTASAYRWMNFRGGWGLVFNNMLSGSAPGIEVVNLRGCDVDTGQPGQVDNAYFWNNTSGGAEAPLSIGLNNTCDATRPLTQNSTSTLDNKSAYYTLNPSFNGTTQHGIGRGTVVPTSSSNNPPHADAKGARVDGDAFWVASTATPTVTPTVI